MPARGRQPKDSSDETKAPETDKPAGLALAASFKSKGISTLPNNASGLAQFYNLMFMDRNIKLPPHLRPVVMALMDQRITKLIIIIGPGSGKSMLLSVTFPAFVLGQDPTQTILAVSAGEGLMQGFMSSVMEWIEHSAMWKLLFPKVKPDKTKGWSKEVGMFVTGRNPGDPDASFFAAGLSSKVLTGKHAKILIFDDLHDQENSNSVDACMKVRDSYYRQLLGRADPQGARFIFAGRRWHEEDIYGHLKATGEYVVMHLLAVQDDKNSEDLCWDITIPDGLVCCLNESVFMSEDEKAESLEKINEQMPV